MLTLTYAFGIYTLSYNGKSIYKTKSINDLTDNDFVMQLLKNNNITDNPTVNITTYCDDTDSIMAATDALLFAVMACWNTTLYHGDTIKLEIKASYEPEDKQSNHTKELQLCH